MRDPKEGGCSAGERGSFLGGQHPSWCGLWRGVGLVGRAISAAGALLVHALQALCMAQPLARLRGRDWWLAQPTRPFWCRRRADVSAGGKHGRCMGCYATSAALSRSAHVLGGNTHTTQAALFTQTVVLKHSPNPAPDRSPSSAESYESSTCTRTAPCLTASMSTARCAQRQHVGDLGVPGAGSTAPEAWEGGGASQHCRRHDTGP